MPRYLFAVTVPGADYPKYFNFSQTGPCEVTLTTRAPSKEGKPGDTASFVLKDDEVQTLAHELNQVIARFTSNA